MNYKKRLLRLSFLIAFLAFFGLGSSAWATTYYSLKNGDWNNTSSDIWALSSGGTAVADYPSAGDTVVIESDHDITIDVDVSSTVAPTKIIIKDQGTLTTGDYELYINGDLEISSISAGALDATGQTTATNDLTIIGDIKITSPSTAAVILFPVDADIDTELKGEFNILSPATVTATNGTSLILSGSNSVVLPSAITTLGDLTVTKSGGSSATLSANLETDAAGVLTGFLSVTSGTLYTAGNNLTVDLTTNVASGATLDASGTGTNTFTTGITNNGTIKANGATNVFTAAYPAGGTGTLYIDNSDTDFDGTIAFTNQTVYARGADVQFVGAVTSAASKFFTDSRTDIDLDNTWTTADSRTIGDINVGAALTLGASLIVEGDLTNGNTITNTQFSLTVYGTLDNTAATIDLSTGAGDKLVVYGQVSDWGTLTDAATTDLEIRGSGSVPANIPAAVTTLNNFVLDRDQTILLGDGVTFSGNVTINDGILALDPGAATVFGDAGTDEVSINEGGTIRANAATSATFTSILKGTGTLDADANDEIIFNNGTPTFTGNFLTANTTIIEFNTTLIVYSLPSSITALEELQMLGGVAHEITLNNDLTLASAIAVTNFDDGTLYLNGHTLTCEAAFGAGATNTLNITEGSTLVCETTSDFAGLTALTTNETSNLTFEGAVSNFPAIANRKVNNLTLSANMTSTATTDLSVYGDLTVGSGATFTATGAITNVYGDILNTGTIDISAAGVILYVHGQMSGTGSYTTDAANSDLVVRGNDAQFSLPANITVLNSIDVERPAGMKINADLTVGNATTGVLQLTGGDFDLNGFNVTFAATDGGAVLVENVGYNVINSSSTEAYITTSSMSVGNTITTGIGLTAAEATGNLTVQRYPLSKAISGVGNSVSRIYNIVNSGGAGDLETFTFAYDDSELNGNRAAALTIQSASDIDFTSPTQIDADDLTNSTRSVEYPATSADLNYDSGLYFTFASETAVAGVTNTFDRGAGTDDWNTAGNWSNGTVPTINDDVIIPTGYTVEASANIEANTITINGTGSLDINAYTLDVADDVTINSTASDALESAANASIFIDGDLSNTSTGTLDLDAGVNYFYVGGTITNSSSGTISVATTARMTFSGATNVTLPDDITNVHSIYVNKTAGYRVATSEDLTVSGSNTLTVNSGEFYVAPTKDLTVTGTTFVASGGTLTATGTGTMTFNGNVTVDGSGVIDLSGTGDRVLGSDALDIITISSTTLGSLLDLSNSDATINGQLLFGAAGTLNLEGAEVTLATASPKDFATGTTQFNSNTSLIISGTGVISNFPDAGDLLDLTISGINTLNLSGDLDLAGDLTLSVSNAILNIDGYELTVNGTLNAAGGGSNLATIIYDDNSLLTINGDVANQNDYPALVAEDLASYGTMSLTVGGSGTLSDLPTSYTDLYDITMNRTGEDLEFTAAAVVNSLNITAGTVSAEETGDFTVTTTTAVESAGTLDLTSSGANSLRSFTTGLSGSGTITAEGASATALSRVQLETGCAYSFTGNMTTNDYTDLIIYSNQTNDVNVPSSVTSLNKLIIDRQAAAPKVVLNNSLTLKGEITETEFDRGYLTVGSNTLTFDGTFDAAFTNFTLYGANSTLVFNSKSDFTGTLLTELVADETTNITFGGGANAITAFPAYTDLKNLTINTSGARTLTLNTDLELAGNLELDGNGTVTNAILNTSTNNFTVDGNVTNLGVFDINGGTGTITLNGLMSGTGTYLADANTILKIDGTSSQMQLPSGISTLGRLIVERPNGVKIYSNLVLGDGDAAVDDLDLVSGDLDLNGYVITLAEVDAEIDEAAGYTLINSGASSDSRGYITTLSTSAANIVGSDIGISALTGPTAAVAKRYPITVNIPDVGLATKRIFYINNTAAAISAITFVYDETELYSNASALEVYYDDNDNFASNTNLSDVTNVTTTVTEDNPIDGQGIVALTNAPATTPINTNLAAGSKFYYALAAIPGTGGTTYEYAGIDGGNWSTSTNWDPVGVPTSIDQVVIGPYTVVLNGDGTTYECATINLNHEDATLKPLDNTPTGDEVNFRVNGDIDVIAGAEILGVNGTGRINLIIGDGTTAGVSSDITVGNDYTSSNGMWINDLTVNAAELGLSGSANIRISGDITLLANSDVSLEEVEFWGGYDNNQTISVPISANLEMSEMVFDNDANVTTTSNMTVTNAFVVKNDASFIASDGLISFTNGSNSDDPWNVEPDGTLKFYDVEFNHTSDFTPLGTAYIKGDFSQINTGGFVPTSGTIIFENTNQKEIINTSTAGTPSDDLDFYNLIIAVGSSVVTSNDWKVSGDIDVRNNASLIAENGEITLEGTDKEIMNASTQTLFFNDVTISGTYTTEDSWKVAGDMTVSSTGTLEATDGTVTFENIQEKTLANSGTLEFFKIEVADGSQLKTGSNNNDFTVANNATNKTGAGIEVKGTGELDLDPTSTVTFDAGLGMTSGYPKTITKSTNGLLEFGNITIAASPNNEVTTGSDFTITATGGSDFNNAGAGGMFTATAGEITFTGAEPVIISVSPAVTQFYSLATEGATALTLTDDQEIYIAGNFTVDGTSYFEPAGTDSKLIFNGSSDQTIGGSSSALNPMTWADVKIDKTNDSELILAVDTRIGNSVGHELTLTDGILNLGSATFTSGVSTLTRHDGAIDGATGTYVISDNHQTPKLEDIFFTVDGEPTLYNLTVNAAHTTANDLTVNGELYTNTADLTIGSGSDEYSPIKLFLYGNLKRSSGIIAGDVDQSRLVLTGTGTVNNGLSNDYFGGSATTVQLEVGRDETLGGNLNIATDSYLRVNTGVNEFDLDEYTLTFADDALLTMLSGGIKSGDDSKVVLNNDITTIPASMFIDNEVEDLTLAAADLTIGGDLTVNGVLNQTNNNDIITNENLLTFGANATLPTFTENRHVIGNLRRTVNDDATTYSIGDGTDYYPLTLEFANSGSEQLITVSIDEKNPTLGKGGNPDNAVQLLYTIDAEGTVPNDSLKAIFEWDSDVDADELSNINNASFIARWNETYWVDYRNDLENYTASTYSLTTDEYVIEAEDMAGEWAIFSADDATDAEKDDAIDVSGNKIVITKIDPAKPILNNAVKITLELQNQFGQQITSSETFEFTLSSTSVSDGQFNSGNTYTGVIPPNTTSITVSGLTFNTAGAEHQLVTDTTGGSTRWTPTTSSVFPILAGLPASQASSIVFSNVENTSMTVDWTTGGGSNEIVIVKADTLLTEDEYPEDGTTYFANTIYGAGSSIGDAVVVYNGSGTTVDVTGLAPNTTYYVYVFTFNGADGNERYRTSATSGNPNLQATTGSYDDDVTFGTNNTRATSKTIGTNTPVYGTIKSSTDEDWFNFTVTSSSPNIRGTLELSSGLGNYNIELYNEDNRRMRRGIRISNNDEAQVINDLPAGTYTVRIYGVEGAYDTETPYVLKVKTNSNEIFSVTE